MTLQLSVLVFALSAVIRAEAAPSPSPSPSPSPWPEPPSRISFAVPTEDHSTKITGEVDLPPEARCEKGEKRLPALFMVQGTGEFDRDVDFGNSDSPKDLIFKQIAVPLASRGMAVVRQDYRGVHCNRFTLPKGEDAKELFKACVDPELRKNVTPASIESDIRQVYDYVRRLPCVDPERIIVFAHSEGTIHVARLIHRGWIRPYALVMMGMVAESPKGLVHWQSVDRAVHRVMALASDPERATNAELEKAGFLKSELSPAGYLTRKELTGFYERAYLKKAAEERALPDDGVHEKFWSQRWWKMWWNDDERVIDDLRGYPGEIVAHHGDADTQVPMLPQFRLLRAAASSFRHPPKLVAHAGKGHSLGKDGLVGPIADESLKLIFADILRLADLPGTPAGAEPPPTAEEINLRPYFGVTFAVSDTLPKKSGHEFGLVINTVVPAFPAWEAGLRPGDVILEVSGKSVASEPKDKALGEVIKQIGKLPLGRDADVKILRWKTEAAEERDSKKADLPAQDKSLTQILRESEPEKEYVLKWRKSFEIIDLKVAARKPPQPRLDFRPDWPEEPKPKVQQVAESMARIYGTEYDLDDLRKRIAEVGTRADPFRIAEVDYLQHHPFRIEQAAREVVRNIQPGKIGDPGLPFLREALRLLRPKAEPLEASLPLRTGLSPAEHVKQIRDALAEVNALWDKAYARLSKDEIAYLQQNLPGLAALFEDWNYVYQDQDAERRERNFQVITLAARVDLEPLLRGAARLLSLSDPSYVRGLKADLARAGKDLRAHEIIREDTPYGAIVIAGTDDDWHNDLDGTAVLIDLGGANVFTNRAGSSTSKTHASIVVNAGDGATYESNVDYGLGTGFMGIGIVANLGSGNSYIGMRGAEGAGLLGVGLVVDRGGGNTYRASAFAQGCGFMGVGGLLALEGGNRFEARVHAQGTGIAGGVGALVDVKGGDELFAKGTHPSGYGTAGTFDGWSQGMGVGMRTLASGGVGILYEGGGKNRFDAGDFSQGGGYYFGWGILMSGKGNDSYVGSRYAQGFAAHYALGTFLDEGGDDRYESRSGVAQGIAMDMSVAWFEDRGGRNLYSAKGFTLGSSAHNAIAVFIDDGGESHYEGPVPVASGQVNDYHGGTSLSLFFDLGAGKSRFDALPARVPVDARDEDTYTFAGFRDLDAILKPGALEREMGTFEKVLK